MEITATKKKKTQTMRGGGGELRGGGEVRKLRELSFKTELANENSASRYHFDIYGTIFSSIFEFELTRTLNLNSGIKRNVFFKYFH